MKVAGFTKLRLRRYAVARRNDAQNRMDATPSSDKLRLSRELGCRDAWEDLLSALDDGLIERSLVRRPTPAPPPGDAK